MDSAPVIEVLALARAVLAAGRCRGPFASDGTGEVEVEITSPNATCYCAAGAMHFAAWQLGLAGDHPAFLTARRYLSEVAYAFLLTRAENSELLWSILRTNNSLNWAIFANDYARLTDPEMLALYDDAAALVGGK